MSSVSFSVESRFPYTQSAIRRPDGTVMARVHDADFVALAPLPREQGAWTVFLMLAMIPLFAALGAKSFLLARLDGVALAEMLAPVSELGAVGRGLAWLMQPDPVTGALAPLLAGLLG